MQVTGKPFPQRSATGRAMKADPEACRRLFAKLRAFQREGLFCDVVLLGAGQRLPAHRVVLVAAGLLKPGDLAEELRFVGISKQHLLCLIDLIYADEGDALPAGLVQCCAALELPEPSDARAVQLAERLQSLRGAEATCDLQLSTAIGGCLWTHRVVLAAGNAVLCDFLKSATQDTAAPCYQLTLQAINDLKALEAAITSVYLGTRMPGAGRCSSDVALLCSDWQLPRSISSARESALMPFADRGLPKKRPPPRSWSPRREAARAPIPPVKKAAKAVKVDAEDQALKTGAPRANALYRALLRGVNLDCLPRHGGA